MKKITILLLLISHGLVLVVEGSSNTNLNVFVREIVNDIQGINRVEGFSIGLTEQYKNFEKLKAAASSDELIDLTDHTNAAVRCYAFWALSYHDGVDVSPHSQEASIR